MKEMYENCNYRFKGKSCEDCPLKCKGKESELQRLKKENEKLKQKFEIFDKAYGVNKFVKYKQALDEIRKYCEEQNLKADYTACEVLTMIDEVLNV